MYRTSDFYYDLPKERIAQVPANPRDSARMLRLNRVTGEIVDDVFSNVINYLHEGDVLVINNSKVIPARLYGHKESGANVEVLLLRQREKDYWECLAKPGKRLQVGSTILFSDVLTGTIEEVLPDGNRMIRFQYGDGDFYSILDQLGKMPIPPYITEELKDNSDYQTVYAKPEGSAAAPTAGLHFTPELLEAIQRKGVQIATVTLHVGLGTFRPVKEENITDHVMHSEQYFVDEENAAVIQKALDEKRRVICVGTTSCRTVESIYQKHGCICSCSEDTDIYIYPGYQFHVMSGLITNFHLPESTLIMLVSAFAGYENTMHAYRYAVEQEYRFYSFGDAMLIL